MYPKIADKQYMGILDIRGGGSDQPQILGTSYVEVPIPTEMPVNFRECCRDKHVCKRKVGRRAQLKR